MAQVDDAGNISVPKSLFFGAILTFVSMVGAGGFAMGNLSNTVATLGEVNKNFQTAVTLRFEKDEAQTAEGFRETRNILNDIAQRLARIQATLELSSPHKMKDD